MKFFRPIVVVVFLFFSVVSFFIFEYRKPTRPPIVFVHWMADRNWIFDELSLEYYSQTGTTVQNMLISPAEAYTHQIKKVMNTNQLPDIFGILDSQEAVAETIKNGHVLNLTEDLGSGPSSWLSTFYRKAIEPLHYQAGNRFGVPQGYYGIPINMINFRIFFNKKLFRKAKIDPEVPPKNWNEFLQMGKKLKSIGVEGLSSGFAENWLVYQFAMDLALRFMGQENVEDTFRGHISYTSEKWLKVFKAFEQLKQFGLIENKVLSRNNISAEKHFSDEGSAMIYDGSWAQTGLNHLSDELDYGTFELPGSTDELEQSCRLQTGAVFFVNARSKQKGEAVKYLKWLTQKTQAKFLTGLTENISAVQSANEDLIRRYPHFQCHLNDLEKKNEFQVTERLDVQLALIENVGKILGGKQSARQAAAAIQTVKKPQKQ